jgi:hypothetical protein
MHECESDPHVRKRTPSFIRTYSAERAFVRPGSSAMAAGFGRTQSVHASFNYFSAVARTPSSDSFSLKRTESLLKTGEQDLSNPLGQTTPETSDASKIRRSSAALKEELQSQCARFILSDQYLLECKHRISQAQIREEENSRNSRSGKSILSVFLISNRQALSRCEDERRTE